MSQSEVTGWILAGGEGRRMGGANKGLQPYRGQPLASWVIRALHAQAGALHVNANRDLDRYVALLDAASPGGRVWPDDQDINAALGPLAGILTGLRQVSTPWLMVVACDTPALPLTLVHQLHQQALDHHADIAVPVTQDANGETRHHWTCAMMHARTRASLESALAEGERRVGQWVKSGTWVAVPFDAPAAFINVNTLETLHGPV